MPILQKPKKIPTSSGVYFFRDKKREILYIGKAANLKNRLSSYFFKLHGGSASLRGNNSAGWPTKEPRILKMLEEAKKLDWQETGSEVAALILESQLIKKHRPKFNILLRDDKQYFYVTFTNDKFPKIFTTHQPKSVPSFQFPVSRSYKKLKTINYKLETGFVGPFTDGRALKTTLKLLRRVFPYCSCKRPHYNYCLNYHLGNCPGFCCLKKSESRIMNYELRKYKENIRTVKKILSGKKSTIIKGLEKKMNQQAREKNFEDAITLRNQISKIKKVLENAKLIQNKSYDIMIYHRIGSHNVLKSLRKVFKLPASPQRIEGYDISNIQGQAATGSMAVFTNGQADKSQYRKFKIRSSNSADDTKMLKEILARRLKHKEWPYPDLIIVDGGKGQLAVTLAVLKSLKLKIPTLALTKDARHHGHHIFTNTVQKTVLLKNLPEKVKNLILSVDAEAHRFALSYYRKRHRKDAMGSKTKTIC